MKQVELLAPVGKFENALAAIENGADAIFVGGKAFNARQYADNFDTEELKKIVDYCRLRNVKTHITVNVLVKQDELMPLIDYLKELTTIGVDAIIVQDFGVARIVKTYFPKLEMHASTQMTAHSLEDVKFLEQCGFSRIVLARELSLKDIAYIRKHTKLELETFIHGALCYAYSGQCLLSSTIGGRSGNRGRCAQPCRMTYSLHKDDEVLLKDVHVLSPKDMSTLEILPELVACGIDSFKIEGRMKSPEYVAAVTRIYRKYIQQAIQEPSNYRIDPKDFEDLQSIFNRGGFTTGYYQQKANKEMLTEKTPKHIGLRIGYVKTYNPKKKLVSIYTDYALHPGDGLEIWNKKKHTGVGISKDYAPKTCITLHIEDWVDEGSPVYLSKNHTLLKNLKKTYSKPLRKRPIRLTIKGTIDKAIEMEVMWDNEKIKVYGEKVQQATQKPMTKEDVEKQMVKFGNTPFEVVESTIEWDEQGYMPNSQLNALRREAAALLEQTILSVDNQEIIAYTPPVLDLPSQKPVYTAHVRTQEQLETCLAAYPIESIYWEWQYNNEKAKEVLDACEKKGKKCYLVLPHIIKDTLWEKYKKDLLTWKQTPLAGFVIRTYGSYEVLKNMQKEIIVDFTLNTMNNEAIRHWLDKKATRVTPSLELTKEEYDKLQGPLETIVYGHIPVMTTEQCVLGNFGYCLKNKSDHRGYALKDRKEVKWPILTDCKGCKMQILTDKPLLLSDKNKNSLQSTQAYRMVFTYERQETMEKVFDYLFENKPYKNPTYPNFSQKPVE